MSIENNDHFKLWESSFDALELPEMPKDPLDAIVDYTADPVECAKEIHKYLYKNPEDAHSSLMRRGLAKLAYKYYGQYHGKQLAVVADEAFAVPETDKTHRKREILQTSQYSGTIFARGNMATFRTIDFRDGETGVESTLITLCLSEPYLINANGDINTDHELPDYLLLPIQKVQEYKFKPDEIANS
ncbi:MAG: hypothetical protein H6797_03300 [Candidatus Nomurabacteria bacterium]|nr:MAG: hypothetical protein H6797_03300 [Candidatus Nomurabacteria bacterium]